MIDAIFTALLEFDALGNNYNKRTIDVLNPDGTIEQKEELWYNSKSDIVFGDSCSWLIGSGRITNVCGPDLKVVCDWTIALDWIPGFSKLGSARPGLYAALMGAGGTTDLILGGKDLFSYGATTDFAFTRKKYPTIKVDKTKYVKSGDDSWDENDEDYFPLMLKVAVFAPYLLILGAVVTTRLAYMQVFSNKTLRDELQRWVIMTVPLIESRWVAGIKIIETLFHSGKLIIRLTKKAKAKAKEVKRETQSITSDVAKLIATSPVIQETQRESAILLRESKDLLTQTKSDIIDIIDQGVDAINSLVGGVPGLEHIRFDRETLSGNKIMSAASFQYDAESKIEWKVKGEDTSAKILMSGDEFESSVLITPVQVNTSTPIGSISVGKESKGVDISVKEDGSVIQLQHKGGDRSQLNIYPNSLEIQSGSAPFSAPSISLKDGTIVLRTGLPSVGPKITLTDNRIVMSLGLPTLGSKITMTATSLDISVGASKLSLTPTGIEQKVGEIVTAKLGLLQQELKVAENKLALNVASLEQQAIVTKRNSEAIAKLEATLADYQTKAIVKEQLGVNIIK